MFPIRSLPEDLVLEIIARVPSRSHRLLSFVSKRFRSLVASPELYAKRCLLGCIEHCVYAVIRNRLYNLPREAESLVLIPSRLDMPRHGIYIIVRSVIYVLDKKTSNWFSIDCRSHTVQPLPSLPMPMSDGYATFIDGKIYVVRVCGWEAGLLHEVMRGQCSRKDRLSHKVVVFDTETQMWEPTMPDTELCDTDHCVMWFDKTYKRSSIVYRPKEYKSDMEEILDNKMWDSACVVDDVWYRYDYRENNLKAFDPKQMCWIVVKGVENLLYQRTYSSWNSYTVNYGGKLAVILRRSCGSSGYMYIYCAEIALERGQEGEILGKVERHREVFSDRCSYLKKLLRVIV